MENQPNLELNALKNNVVTQLFVDQADQDYILARMAYHKSLFTGFFWSAGQAMEKYLKASLLLNERTAKLRDHNIIALFDLVKEYAADLLPNQLTKPPQFGDLPWREETPVEFITRIEQYVNPHNRYNIFGYSTRYEDIFHLDQLIFSLRRITFQFDAYPFLGRSDGREGVPQTVRELLEKIADYSPRNANSRLHKLIDSDEDLRYAALNLNFPFTPLEYDHQWDDMKLVFSMAAPVLYTRIIGRVDKQQATPGDTNAAALADWILENIILPGDVKNEVKAAALKLRKGE